MSADILSLGSAYVDINEPLFPVKSLREREKSEVVGANYEIVPGGSALNFAQMCARLDLKPVFVGKIGNDEMGRILTEQVEEKGVIPGFIQADNVSTNVSVNLGIEDYVYEVLGTANQSLEPDEVRARLEYYLGDVKYFYLGGVFKLRNLLPTLAALAEEAQSRGVEVVLDHGRITNQVSDDDKQTVRDLLSHVDYYLPSRDEFLDLWDAQSLDEAFARVRQISKAVLVVKDGENGAIGMDGKQIFRVPAFDVIVNNLVGAGDAFNAGFIKGRSLGENLATSMAYGCATAALKISASELPTLEKVRSLL